MPEKHQVERKFTFLQIFEGNLVERSKTPKPGFREKEVFEKDGTTSRGFTYLRPIHALEQFLLRDIAYENKQLANNTNIESLKVRFQDATDSLVIYQIEFHYPSVVASQFMKLLPNIVFGEPLEIAVRAEKGTTQGSIFFKNADGENLKHFFSRNEPNGMPDATQNKTTQKWNYTLQNDFLLDNTLEIAGKLKDFWAKNAEIFETEPKDTQSTITTKKLLDDDEPLEQQEQPQQSTRPAVPPVRRTEDNMFPNQQGGGEDDLPF